MMDDSMRTDEIPFLDALPEPEREALVAQGRRLVLGRGTPVWSAGDPARDIALMLAGFVKLVSTHGTGRETILDTVPAGHVACSIALGADTSFCCRAEALSDGTQVLFLPRTEVLAALERNPSAVPRFLEATVGRARCSCRRIAEMGSGSVEQRLATIMLRLAETIGEPLPDGVVQIPLRLSRQELADLVGTTIETTIRTLGRLRDEGILRDVRGGFELVQPLALERIAHGVPHAATETGPVPVSARDADTPLTP